MYIFCVVVPGRNCYNYYISKAKLLLGLGSSPITGLAQKYRRIKYGR